MNLREFLSLLIDAITGFLFIALCVWALVVGPGLILEWL